MAHTDHIRPWALPLQKDYIFTNATVVDVTDGSLHVDKTLCLSKGRFKSISESGSPIAAPQDAILVNVEGKYLVPGLIDCHVHLATPPGEQGLKDIMNQDPDTSLLRQPWLARQMLNRGFTTIRDCGGAGLALKEAIADSLHLGPGLFISGHGISQTGGHGDLRSSKDAEYECCGGHAKGLGRIADGVEQCLHAAREELRQGADFIKIMCSGGVVSATDRLTSLQYTPEEIRAFVKVASDAGENGVRSIEHGNLIDESAARLMKDKGAFLTPTLITYKTMASTEFGDFLPPSIAAKNKQVLESGFESIRIADDVGVKMCYGTDLLGPLQIKQTGEFALRSQVLSPLKVLQSATLNAADLLGQESNLGRIQEGFIGDMLVLEVDPLEDVAVFDRPEECLSAVLKEGRVVMSRLPGLET